MVLCQGKPEPETQLISVPEVGLNLQATALVMKHPPLAHNSYLLRTMAQIEHWHINRLNNGRFR